MPGRDRRSVANEHIRQRQVHQTAGQSGFPARGRCRARAGNRTRPGPRRRSVTGGQPASAPIPPFRICEMNSPNVSDQHIIVLILELEHFMNVSMADINRNPNQIINRVVDSGEPVVVLKHGKPIAEIRPLSDNAERDKAIAYLSTLKPVSVRLPLEQAISEGRRRGL